MKTEANSPTWKDVDDFGRIAGLFRTLRLVLSFALATGLAVSCATQQPTAQTQDLLLASGFKVVKAVTPAQQAHLNSLPRGRVTIVNRKGKTWYVFPDAAHNQMYLGNSNQYQSFLQTYQDAKLINDRVGEANLAEDSAEWEAWDALGVWGVAD